MAFCCLSIGSNIGDCADNIAHALRLINRIESTQLDKCSETFVSTPWGHVDQDDFLNIACGLVTDLEAHQLLRALQGIELQLRRVRKEHWGPRLIDIDIICFDDVQINSPTLQLPHPYFSQRSFVLLPLFSIYPEHKILGKACSHWWQLHQQKHPDECIPILTCLKKE